MLHFQARTASGELINSALREFTFPAGEKHIKVADNRDVEDIEIAVLYADHYMHEDLFALAMWADICHQKNVKQTQIVIPYFPGARADRGEPFGLHIYAKFLMDLHVSEIAIFDPHSEVLEKELKKCNTNSIFTRTKLTFLYPHDLLKLNSAKKLFEEGNYTGIIAPDKGATKRSGAFADAMGLPLYTVDKTRDFETGKLKGFDVSKIPANDGKLLIVDDICDGGGTFLGIAEAIDPIIKLDLYVSHGVFSNRASENLPTKFGRILTTNSYNPKRVLNNPFTHRDNPPYRRIAVVNFLLDSLTGSL